MRHNTVASGETRDSIATEHANDVGIETLPFMYHPLSPRPMPRLTFLHIVPVPLRNLHHIRSRLLDHRLAPQPRIKLNIRRRLHPIELQVLRLTDTLRAILHPDVTGRTS